MKRMVLWSSIAVIMVIVVAISAALYFGEKSPLIAEGEVMLSSDLTPDAKGVKNVFITVFDENSPMPMPFGAMRETLRQDAEGKFLSFTVTKETLRIMNPNQPYPEQMRIKVRLDRDGMGGADQPGDLTGVAHGVRFGQRDLQIKIDTRVQ